MPATHFLEYAQSQQKVVNELVAGGDAQLLQFTMDARSAVRGFIAGVLRFTDESELNFREFIDLTQDDLRLMYAYHYQDKQKLLIFRYDNAAHRPPLSQASHKHMPDRIDVCPSPTLADVIAEILA